MKPLVFARWELECDPLATRDLYRKRATGSAEACGCLQCLNFVAARSRLYPSAALNLFEQLGINSEREIEVSYNARIEAGKHHYAGFFHLIGKITDGVDASRQIAANAWTFDLEKVNEHFHLGFTSRIALLDVSFATLPIVQLEFQAIVPWLLSEPEPEW
jgi:hypothetical protein